MVGACEQRKRCSLHWCCAAAARRCGGRRCGLVVTCRGGAGVAPAVGGSAACGVAAAVGDGDRLDALRRLVLLDTPSSIPFDRVATMAARLLGTAAAVVTLVDRDRQWFKSSLGLPEPIAGRRETPLAYSFCQYVVAAGEPVLVADGHSDREFCDHAAVVELGVVAYAGAPLFAPGGQAVGAVGVLDRSPRDWTDTDRGNLADLAGIATREIDLHVREVRDAHRRMWPSRSGNGAGRW